MFLLCFVLLRLYCSCLLDSLQRRHNEHDGISNHQPQDCLLNRLFKAQIKENTKAPRHWPLLGEFNCDRWIPCTKSQLCRNCFHLMKLSCDVIQGSFTGIRLITRLPGPLFTKKILSCGYMDPHYKPKTGWRPSQVYNGNPCTGKTVSS